MNKRDMERNLVLACPGLPWLGLAAARLGRLVDTALSFIFFFLLQVMQSGRDVSCIWRADSGKFQKAHGGLRRAKAAAGMPSSSGIVRPAGH